MLFHASICLVLCVVGVEVTVQVALIIPPGDVHTRNQQRGNTLHMTPRTPTVHFNVIWDAAVVLQAIHPGLADITTFLEQFWDPTVPTSVALEARLEWDLLALKTSDWSFTLRLHVARQQRWCIFRGVVRAEIELASVVWIRQIHAVISACHILCVPGLEVALDLLASEAGRHLEIHAFMPLRALTSSARCIGVVAGSMESSTVLANLQILIAF